MRPAGKGCEDAVEHPEPASADEAVVERLVRTIILRRILPLQAVLDHIDDCLSLPGGHLLSAPHATDGAEARADHDRYHAP